MLYRSLTRRRFLQSTVVAAGGLAAISASKTGVAAGDEQSSVVSKTILPEGNAPAPVSFSHFPSRLHAFVWRNWQLVAAERMAEVIGAKPEDILRIGAEMGLREAPVITADQRRRSYITVLRRNWHLLPYDQLLALLGWTPEQLAYSLDRDDGIFWKFGSVKPKCERLQYSPPDEPTRERAQGIARRIAEAFPGGVGNIGEPLFQFVADLSAPCKTPPSAPRKSRFSPRYCYSYFAPFGDPLLNTDVDPYPEGYLARLAETGVDGVWLHTELSKLAPFPWDVQQSEFFEKRLENLRALVARARKFGMGVYLYLNEPKAKPLAFFETRPGLKGIPATTPWEAGTATLCTSVPEVQQYLTNSVAYVSRAVPDLAAFFTITASEALTNCWSHGGGAVCPRCGKRSPAEVISELIGLYRAGIQQAGNPIQLIAWDWGWSDDWAEEAIERLPDGISFMSVSEWSIPIDRGGVKSVIGEYSISAVGPGPRATKHWQIARQRGLKTLAKIQAGNTWEFSTAPYIPAVANVARHAANLRDAQVNGIMLGWSLGGYPSPNLEVVAELGQSDDVTPEAAMENVARRRFGERLAPAAVQAWREFSAAFGEFPFGSGLYNTPTQFGPANLLWEEPTRYPSGPVGFPYDDLDGWRGQYPPEVFIGQFEKVADGFESALARLKQAAADIDSQLQPDERSAAAKEINVAETATLHFRSVANQSRFVWTRNSLAAAKSKEEAAPLLDALEKTLREEIESARRLYAIQMKDSRIGYEASNHYYYVPLDLAEKVLNCRDLLERWLPGQKTKWFG